MDWIVPSGPRYRFAEPVEREELLARTAPRRARRAHLAVARALVELESQRGRRPSFQRAFHLREGEAFDELLSILPEMLRRLREAGHPHRLATLAGWGLEAHDEVGGGEGSMTTANLAQGRAPTVVGNLKSRPLFRRELFRANLRPAARLGLAVALDVPLHFTSPM